MPKKNKKIKASWKVESSQNLLKDYIGRVDKSKPMTEEEEADEIIRRLTKTQKELDQERADALENELTQILAEEIRKEIDAEVVREMTKRSIQGDTK